MSFVTSGASSFTRFFAIGERPASYREVYLPYIQEYAFWDIDQTDGEESYGWVSTDDITDFGFETEACFRDEFISLAIRVDRRKIPKSIEKLHQRQAEKELLAQTGAEQLSKFQKKELADVVHKKLIQRIPPTPEVFDMVWNTLTDEVFLGATNQAAIDRFIDMFTTTFRLGLRLAFPYALGDKLVTEQALKERLEELEPADYRPKGLDSTESKDESHE